MQLSIAEPAHAKKAVVRGESKEANWHQVTEERLGSAKVLSGAIIAFPPTDPGSLEDNLSRRTCHLSFQWSHLAPTVRTRLRGRGRERAIAESRQELMEICLRTRVTGIEEAMNSKW